MSRPSVERTLCLIVFITMAPSKFSCSLTLTAAESHENMAVSSTPSIKDEIDFPEPADSFNAMATEFVGESKLVWLYLDDSDERFLTSSRKASVIRQDDVVNIRMG